MSHHQRSPIDRRWPVMTSELVERERVVAEARKWVGTRYHACADARGAGVDCGMLLVRVFVDTGLLAPFDPRPYPEDWHLHRNEERYLSFATDRFREVANPGPGDIIVFKYGRTFSHGAIVTGVDPIRIVHAFQPCRAVIEEDMQTNQQLLEPKRPRRFFSLWAHAGTDERGST